MIVMKYTVNLVIMFIQLVPALAQPRHETPKTTFLLQTSRVEGRPQVFGPVLDPLGLRLGRMGDRNKPKEAASEVPLFPHGTQSKVITSVHGTRDEQLKPERRNESAFQFVDAIQRELSENRTELGIPCGEVLPHFRCQQEPAQQNWPPRAPEQIHGRLFHQSLDVDETHNGAFGAQLCFIIHVLCKAIYFLHTRHWVVPLNPLNMADETPQPDTLSVNQPDKNINNNQTS